MQTQAMFTRPTQTQAHLRCARAFKHPNMADDVEVLFLVFGQDDKSAGYKITEKQGKKNNLYGSEKSFDKVQGDYRAESVTSDE